MVEVNRKLTSKDSWRKKRSENQIRLHEEKEYTQKRIDAMSTPESIAKSKKTNKLRLDAMTKTERKKMYGRDKTPEQLKKQSNKIKGRKKIVNLKTKEVKVIQPNDIQFYLNSGWQLWNDVSKETKHRLFGKRTAWNKGLTRKQR